MPSGGDSCEGEQLVGSALRCKRRRAPAGHQDSEGESASVIVASLLLSQKKEPDPQHRRDEIPDAPRHRH